MAACPPTASSSRAGMPPAIASIPTTTWLRAQLIHDVYYALRKGKAWDSTLLVITYDEHGGNYDHVAPPNDATPPGDGTVGEFGFDFTRFGLRVPAVLVSPLIAEGTVFRAAK